MGLGTRASQAQLPGPGISLGRRAAWWVVWDDVRLDAAVRDRLPNPTCFWNVDRCRRTGERCLLSYLTYLKSSHGSIDYPFPSAK